MVQLELTLHLLLVLLAAVGGWRAAAALRIPSAEIIGSMFGAGLVSIQGANILPLEPFLRFTLQVIVGCALGLRIDGNFTKQLTKLLGPAIVVSVWAIVTSVAGAMVLMAWADLDKTTALFAATPGGISEMTLAAASFRAHTPTVAILQLCRLSGILLVIPPLVQAQRREIAATLHEVVTKRVLNVKQSAQFLVVALVGGYIVQSLRLPAGSLVGAMLATASLSLHLATKRDVGCLHPNVVRLAQVAVGMLVGLNFTPEIVSRLGQLAWPALLISTIMIGSGLALGKVLQWWTRWDLVTCWLASAPAGLPQMGILSEALHANVGVVSTLHMIRLITVVTVLVPILGILLGGV